MVACNFHGARGDKKRCNQVSARIGERQPRDTAGGISKHLWVAFQPEKPFGKTGPVTESMLACQLHSPPPFDLYARPISNVRGRLVDRHREAKPSSLEFPDRNDRGLAIRLTRYRVGCGGNNSINTRRRRRFACPMNRGEGRAARGIFADQDAKQCCAMRAGHTSQIRRIQVKVGRVLGMDLQERLGHMERQPGRKPRCGSSYATDPARGRCLGDKEIWGSFLLPCRSA